MDIITEIVTMKIVEGISNEDFFNIVDDLEKNYHAKQAGFIDTELLFNDKYNQWIMIQHWDSMDCLTGASKKMFTDKRASTFVKSVDARSVKMMMLAQLGKW